MCNGALLSYLRNDSSQLTRPILIDFAAQVISLSYSLFQYLHTCPDLTVTLHVALGGIRNGISREGALYS